MAVIAVILHLASIILLTQNTFSVSYSKSRIADNYESASSAEFVQFQISKHALISQIPNGEFILLKSEMHSIFYFKNFWNIKKKIVTF